MYYQVGVLERVERGYKVQTLWRLCQFQRGTESEEEERDGSDRDTQTNMVILHGLISCIINTKLVIL